MEEELSENELEERLYGMLHFVDENGGNESTNPKDIDIVDNGHRSTIKRYWRTSSVNNTTYQKVNTQKDSVINKYVTNNQPKTNNEKILPTNPSVDLSILQQPVSQNVQKTVEILENEEEYRVVELESSDEDEVIEVALPPKPTITIESSDEEEVCAVPLESPTTFSKPTQEKASADREVTASPVPSVVSSVSDEFIRGDCIALNISSQHPINQSFDFSLHDADLLDQTPKKKKKKSNKDATSTPNTTLATNTSAVNLEECFATPKTKAKKKRPRTKSYKVSGKSIPNADVYDSDSNQSINDNNKTQNSYIVTDKSLPSTDVYESDSNQSENNKETIAVEVPQSKEVNSSCKIPTNISVTETPTSNNKNINEAVDATIVDLTDTENITIDENILMVNVTGFTIDDNSNDSLTHLHDISNCGSTKIPAILSADLDFDNLKGNAKTCKSRRYSLTTLREEMDKFYNESWGGEEFNHREIQKNMSRDKSLWVIDAKDRMSSLSKRRTTCNYCNRPGHRDDTCRMKPAICFMCGSTGHFEPRCPKKICVNCGSPNHMYSTMCRNCCNWNYMKCAECGQKGHPASHCPDIWRRYHNTVSLETPLEESQSVKKHYQMFCSGCTRRGHLVHTCRISLPFSGLPVNSPYVAVYRPVYQIQRNHCSQNHDPNLQRKENYKNKIVNQNQENSLCSFNQTSRNEHLKRQSKSPITHDTLNKKRNLGMSNDSEIPQRTKSPMNTNSQRKNSQSRDPTAVPHKDGPEPNKIVKKATIEDSSKAPDFIPIASHNHDKRGQIIQDNEVSDTSEVITSARMYITKEVNNKLEADEGRLWLKETIKKNNLILENSDVNYLCIKGSVGNQEAFQSELREWIKTKTHPIKERLISENTDGETTLDMTNEPNSMSHNIPKNRNIVLRKISKALESLKKHLGDPRAMYKELVYLQNRHQQLLNQKVISPAQLGNNKENMNGMLRKLNMVLLGQAGLADGPKHLSELYSLQERLTNFRQKNISPSLREEIGEHYHCIFTAIPRDDYTELLSKYYNKQTLQFKKKKYDKAFKVSPNPNLQKQFNTIQNVKRNINIGKEETIHIDENELSNTKSLAIKKTKNKLVFYHRRLINSQTNDTVLKKLRNKLVNKLHRNIALLGNTNQMSSKDLTYMRKIQEQAQIFLANI